MNYDVARGPDWLAANLERVLLQRQNKVKLSFTAGFNFDYLTYALRR